MELKIIYEDENVLVIDKPAGIVVFPEKSTKTKTLIDELLKEFPHLKDAGKTPRYGIVHRLDKDTSGILLIAKNNKTLGFLQKELKFRRAIKKYLALAVGNLKDNQGVIETLIGRAPKKGIKQKVYLFYEPGTKGKRKAVTEYKVLARFHQYSGSQEKYYTLVEIIPKTGRKHQIRTHLAYIGYPIAGDKLYAFKNQPCPKNLSRHFLHASYLKIKLPDGKDYNPPSASSHPSLRSGWAPKEFKSDLPENLKRVLENLKTN